jgi:hypothetical protein
MLQGSSETEFRGGHADTGLVAISTEKDIKKKHCGWQ